jgi:hypothetical protein
MRYFVRLTRAQYDFIMSQGKDAATYIRSLIDKEMAKRRAKP